MLYEIIPLVNLLKRKELRSEKFSDNFLMEKMPWKSWGIRDCLKRFCFILMDYFHNCCISMIALFWVFFCLFGWLCCCCCLFFSLLKLSFFLFFLWSDLTYHLKFGWVTDYAPDLHLWDKLYSLVKVVQ